jgi:mannose/fructose-specific phosphotransferase system component IIA
LIVGPQQGVRILSNKELSSETLSEAIRSELLSYSGEETVIFVDVAGGSCLSACRIEEGERNKIKVISGVNLPMVLEFFHYRGRMPFAELVERVAAKGRGGIQTL